MPHVSECGHIFCYLCLYAETYNYGASASNSGGVSDGSVEDESVGIGGDAMDVRRCPACFTTLRGCRPYDEGEEALEGEGEE